ncbi:MAG: hypothetical protein R3B84_08705 [Zavarzinella sp.]
MKFTVKHALGLWLLLWLIVSAHSLLPRKQGKLYITFASAGEHFWHEQPLYGDFPETHDQYRYSPFVAALLGPWHWLPPWLGEFSGVGASWVQSSLVVAGGRISFRVSHGGTC